MSLKDLFSFFFLISLEVQWHRIGQKGKYVSPSLGRKRDILAERYQSRIDTGMYWQNKWENNSGHKTIKLQSLYGPSLDELEGENWKLLTAEKITFL